jgi:hypothetical protein
MVAHFGISVHNLGIQIHGAKQAILLVLYACVWLSEKISSDYNDVTLITSSLFSLSAKHMHRGSRTGRLQDSSTASLLTVCTPAAMAEMCVMDTAASNQ